jgi:hypothetical protein
MVSGALPIAASLEATPDCAIFIYEGHADRHFMG